MRSATHTEKKQCTGCLLLGAYCRRTEIDLIVIMNKAEFLAESSVPSTYLLGGCLSLLLAAPVLRQRNERKYEQVSKFLLTLFSIHTSCPRDINLFTMRIFSFLGVVHNLVITLIAQYRGGARWT